MSNYTTTTSIIKVETPTLEDTAMDTTTEIMERLLNDLFFNDDNKLHSNYSKYYDSLDASQSKEVVSGALKKILNENNNAKCEFGEDTFTLTVE